jgi:hypothetical protein
MSDMSMSFAAGSPSKLNTQTVKTLNPYDPDFKLNKKLGGYENNPFTLVFSLDPAAILDILHKEDFASLSRLTLRGAAAHGKPGLWDVLWNIARQQSFTACFLTATETFEAIPAKRVVTCSDFIDYSMWVSRLHLNQVQEGDRVGMAIRDAQNATIFMLVYRIDGADSALIEDATGVNRPSLVPAVNLKLEHAFRYMPSTGDQVGLAMDDAEEFDPERLTRFVQHLFDAVNDIPKSFSWKPHFPPIKGSTQFGRRKMEGRLKHQRTEAVEVDYPAFVAMCHALYRQAKMQYDQKRKSQPKRTEGGDQRKGKPKVEPTRPPMIEVASFGDEILVTFPSGFIIEHPYVRVRKDTIPETAQLIESHLLNKDITNWDDIDTSSLMVLSEETFGPQATVRYLTVNF